MIDFTTQLTNIKKTEEIIQTLKKEEGLKLGSITTTSALCIAPNGKNQIYPISFDSMIRKCLTREKVFEIIEKYTKQLNDVSEANFEIESDKIGAAFVSFPVSKLDSDETFDLIHKPGEIWLIDIWATWCGPCQPAMAHNQEMLEHHPEWKGKVRIFGISLDKTKEEVKKRVEEKKWTSVEHYFSDGAWGSKAAKAYNVQGIPFVALVNQEGIVVKIGHPMECDLENSINALIQGKNLLEKKPVVEVKKEKGMSFEEYYNCVQAIIEKHKEVAVKRSIKFILINTANWISESSTTECRIVLDKPLPKRLEFDIINEVKELLTSLSAVGKVDNKMRFIETFIIEKGKECSKCHKPFSPDASQFKCRECEYALCYACIVDDKHPHILYFIKKDADLEVIYGPGKDKTKPGDDSTVHNGVGCDGCGSKVEGIRWKCANCGDVDICQKCFEKCLNGKLEENKSIYERCEERGHNVDSHVLLRVVRNGSMAY